MALFNQSGPTYQTTSLAANTAAQIYNTLGPSSVGITAGTQLQNLTVINTGPAVAYVGGGSGVTSSGSTIGTPLNPGASVVYEDTQAAGSSSPWNLWAITPAGTAATILCGLGSVIATV